MRGVEPAAPPQGQNSVGTHRQWVEAINRLVQLKFHKTMTGANVNSEVIDNSKDLLNIMNIVSFKEKRKTDTILRCDFAMS